MNLNNSLMIQENKILNIQLESMKVDFDKRLKEKDQVIESERGSLKLIKIEIDERKEVIQKLGIDKTNIIQKHADIVTELEEQKQVLEKLKKTNEKIYEEKTSMKDDLKTQRHIYEIFETTFESKTVDCDKRLKEKDAMLGNERESQKMMKKDIDDTKDFIKTLEVENKSILNSVTESDEKLSKLHEELQKIAEKSEESGEEFSRNPFEGSCHTETK